MRPFNAPVVRFERPLSVADESNKLLLLGLVNYAVKLNGKLRNNKFQMMQIIPPPTSLRWMGAQTSRLQARLMVFNLPNPMISMISMCDFITLTYQPICKTF